MYEFRKLSQPNELIEAYRLLLQMYPDLDMDTFLVSLDQKQGTRVFGLLRDGTLCSVACTCEVCSIDGTLVLWVFDMVTAETERSNGLGRKLIEELEAYARREGFSQLRAHSRRDRVRAHHFWSESVGFEEWCVLFRKDLSS